jgi:trehalose/maltose hydrolase-like predicted phosphorylase
MGVMSGTLDLVQRSCTGTHIRDGVLYFGPRLTGQLGGLSFSMQFQGAPIVVTFAGGRLAVAAHREGVSPPVKVAVRDQVHELRAGDRCTVERRPDPGPQQQAQD